MPPASTTTINRVLVGKFGAAFGLQGWLRVISYTEPVENVVSYLPWQIQLPEHELHWETIEPSEVALQAKGIVVKLATCNNRNQAELYRNVKIYINASQLPKLASDQYYWSELEGLTVNTTQGILLGTVDYLFNTGSNDVLVVKGEKLHYIPFLLGQVVLQVDVVAKQMTVDWDPNF